jgi:hypothetical protein
MIIIIPNYFLKKILKLAKQNEQQQGIIAMDCRNN